MTVYAYIALVNEKTRYYEAADNDEAISRALSLGYSSSVFPVVKCNGCEDCAGEWNLGIVSFTVNGGKNRPCLGLLLAQVYPQQPRENRVHWMSGNKLDRKILAQWSEDHP